MWAEAGPDHDPPWFIAVYEVSKDWDEKTLTWNNKPPFGRYLTTITIPSAYQGYISFYTGSCEAIALEMMSEHVQIDFLARNLTPVNVRPYWTQ